MSRILDLAPHAAIYAGRLLAEAGHDVIRVEPPVGDAIRRLPPYLGGTPHVDRGAYHQFFNAGKRSVTLDTSTPEGLDVFRRLAAIADAVIGPLPPQIDSEMLARDCPRLVVALLTHHQAPEICQYARSGMLALTGAPGQEPSLLGGHVLYAATGAWVGVAVASALVVQELSGVGQVVTTDVQQALEVINEQTIQVYAQTGRTTDRRGRRGAITPVSGAFQCADGWWVLSVPQTPERWFRFLDWVKDPVLSADPTLVEEGRREAEKDMILDRVERWSMTLKKSEAVEGAQEREITSTPVNSPVELADDPQLVHRGFLRDVELPGFGSVPFPSGALATIFDRPLAPAPTLGQHTRELLAELGYSEPEQVALFERGVI
ncbi:MAG TPA: CoA transferase [Chloroflexota bacterium]|jgi:crotonobetainyl-CoA:carnitine CoA-transferase CaiB-like acyl-CoA transferase